MFLLIVRFLCVCCSSDYSFFYVVCPTIVILCAATVIYHTVVIACIVAVIHGVPHYCHYSFHIGPCQVPGYPTDESSTRFRFAGSITRIGNFILINYDAINKTDRKTYH